MTDLEKIEKIKSKVIIMDFAGKDEKGKILKVRWENQCTPSITAYAQFNLSNQITDLGLKTLAKAFKTKRKLTIVSRDFIENQIGEVGIKTIINVLKTGLIINPNLGYSQIGDDAAATIANLFETKTKLRITNLRILVYTGDKLGDDGAKTTAENIGRELAVFDFYDKDKEKLLFFLKLTKQVTLNDLKSKIEKWRKEREKGDSKKSRLVPLLSQLE